MVDRPPPDPAKLLAQWMEWERGEATPGRVESGSPGFGEHNDEVWGEIIGLKASEIEELKARGVI